MVHHLWITHQYPPASCAPVGLPAAPACHSRNAAQSADCAHAPVAPARARSLPIARCDPARARGRRLRGRASDGQALATLGAARVDHGTPATRLHAHEKSVGARAADLGGLIGTFHFGSFVVSRPRCVGPVTASARSAGLALELMSVSGCRHAPEPGAEQQRTRLRSRSRFGGRFARGHRCRLTRFPAPAHAEQTPATKDKLARWRRDAGNRVLHQKPSFRSTTCTTSRGAAAGPDAATNCG